MEEQTVLIEGAVFGEKDWNGGYRYMFYTGNFIVSEDNANPWMPSGMFLVTTHSFTVEIPTNFNPYAAQLECLMAQKKSVLAENELRLQRAEEAIQQHLAISSNEGEEK